MQTSTTIHDTVSIRSTDKEFQGEDLTILALSGDMLLGERVDMVIFQMRMNARRRWGASLGKLWLVSLNE